MSEQHPHDPQPTLQSPASVDAAARQLASARRRRFIKLGGAAVPTALTLASRPVMAWHCNTASTWGSAQGMSNSSYTRSQDASRLFRDETYTVACWVNNSGRATLASSPWTLSPLSCSTSPSASNFYKNYTVAALLSGTGCSGITGLTGAESVWSILNASNGTAMPQGSTVSDFTKLMLVAWLNFMVLNSTLNRCLSPGTTNVLVKFSNCTYVGPTGALWTQANIVTYLKKNFVACIDETCA